jgi:DnaK suppressor protein
MAGGFNSRKIPAKDCRHNPIFTSDVKLTLDGVFMKSPLIALKFKSLFENQKRELLIAHGMIADQFAVQADDLTDEMDFASAELDQSLRIKIRSRENHLIKKIDLALLKIQAGTFGVCECCEEDIELSRLEVRPVADLCLRCKEVEEVTEAKSSSGKLVRRVA